MNFTRETDIPVTDRQKDTQPDYCMPLFAHVHRGITRNTANTWNTTDKPEEHNKLEEHEVHIEHKEHEEHRHENTAIKTITKLIVVSIVSQ